MSTTFKDLPLRTVFVTPALPNVPRVKRGESTCSIPNTDAVRYINPATTVWPTIHGTPAAHAVYSDGHLEASPPTQEDTNP